MRRLEIDFEGRSILITGATTGIGRATALAFAAARGSVVIGDVDPRAEGTANDITAAGGRSLFQETDDHYGWSMDLPHQQRLRDVMDLEIGDGTAQIMKMIIARDKLAAAKT